jgi:hypothetical protein
VSACAYVSMVCVCVCVCACMCVCVCECKWVCRLGWYLTFADE